MERQKAVPFGTYVRNRRLAAGLSLRATARALGCSHVYLGEVERNVRTVMARSWWPKLAQIVPGITLRELEAHAAGTPTSVQLHLADAPPHYQRLGVVLARRIRDRDIEPNTAQKLFELLGEDGYD